MAYRHAGFAGTFAGFFEQDARASAVPALRAAPCTLLFSDAFFDCNRGLEGLIGAGCLPAGCDAAGAAALALSSLIARALSCDALVDCNRRLEGLIGAGCLPAGCDAAGPVPLAVFFLAAPAGAS